MAIITKEDLLKTGSEGMTKEIEIRKIGKVKIKKFTKGERSRANEIAFDIETGKLDTQKFEDFVLLSCMIEPKLEIKDMEETQKLPVGITDKIIKEIYAFSGIES